MRLLLRWLITTMCSDTATHAAMARRMASFTDRDPCVFSAARAAIKPHSPIAQSCRPITYCALAFYALAQLVNSD